MRDSFPFLLNRDPGGLSSYWLVTKTYGYRHWERWAKRIEDSDVMRSKSDKPKEEENEVQPMRSV